jgi:hypothetical protein
MISLCDAGVARLAIAACSLPAEERERWLVGIAKRLEATGQPPESNAPTAAAAPPARPSPAAERTRRWRERRREGRAVLYVEVADPFELADALVDYGLLQEWNVDDRAAVADAVAELLSLLLCDASQDADVMIRARHSET